MPPSGESPPAPPNPTGVKGVKEVTGKTTINLAGCPTHPNWIAWTVVQLLLENSIALDSLGRPKDLFTGNTVHDNCYRQGTVKADSFGLDYRCLQDLGCRGPKTIANCPSSRWNGGANWCVDANASCIDCTNANFPGASPFYRSIITKQPHDD